MDHEQYQNQRYTKDIAYLENKVYLKKILRYLDEIKPTGRILEIGCADGSFSALLRNKYTVMAYGIDISEAMVKKAVLNGVGCIQHDVEEGIPYEDGYFSVVIATEVIEHIYDTDQFIKECYRVLKKGGTLILTTPNLVSITNRLKMVLGKYPSYVPEYKTGGAGHIRAYTVPTLKKQVKDHDFKQVFVYGPNTPYPLNLSFFKLFNAIPELLGDKFPTICSHVILYAKKQK